MSYLIEDSRRELISKSKSSHKGRQRFNRRVKSRVANSVREFNSMDMNKLFKDDILTVNIKINGETNNYLVRISFGGFLAILRDQVERFGNFDLRSILRALVIGFNKDDVYISCSCPDFCLDGSTKIKLLNGEVVSVSDMLEKFNNGEEMWVYSSDEKGDFKPGKVSNVWISGYANDLVKVTLDNDKEILTTPNHRYMLRDGSYKEAKDLYIGQSLMSMYFNYHDGYEYYKKNSESTTKFYSVYEEVASSITGCPKLKRCFNSTDEAAAHFNINHKVKNIEFITLDESIPVYDISVDKYNNFYVDVGVMLHNCYRFGYWTTRNGTNSGAPQNIPSDITNPDDSLGSGCKHILLVLNNTSWLIKVASVINNYVHYMEKHYEKAYADIIYPAIYGKPYEKDVQLGMDDSDDLATDDDSETLDKSNEYGRTRTQFKKGNEEGIRFSSKEIDDEDQQALDLEDN